MDEEDFGRLVQAAYSAAGSHEAWVRFLDRYASAMGASAAWLVHGPSNSSFSVDAHVGFDPRWVQAFHERYRYVNPYHAGLVNMPVGRCHHMRDLLPDQEAMRTEFYTDFVVPQGFHIAGTALKLFADHRGMSGIALHSRAEASVDALIESLPLQQRLSGHLQSALALHQRMVELESVNLDLWAAVGASGLCLVLCYRNGFIKVCSAGADALLRRADGVSCRGGHLVLERTRGSTSLASALGHAMDPAHAGRYSQPQVVHALRPSGLGDYELLILPVPERHASFGLRAMVFIHDPEAQATSSAAVLKALYELTDREACVALSLATGDSPHAVAVKLRISRETLKTHQKTLYQKTGTHRHAELVAKLLGGLARLTRDE